MPMTISPEWQQIALYAVLAALALILLQKIPYVGRAVRFLLSLAMLALVIFVLIQQAPYQPGLARLSEKLGLDRQLVSGEEVRIDMASNGHFWADVVVDGVERRMLVDSGATVTALSEETARLAGVEPDPSLVPVLLRTANGVVQARTGTIASLQVGSIEARNLKIIVSPAFGDLDVLGMNFLSKLASWRVEDRTLILVPRPSEAEDIS